MAKHGLFVVIEGPDGAGKTTAMARVASILRERGITTDTTQEPTDGVIGRLIRSEIANKNSTLDERAMVRLFAADRCAHDASIRDALTSYDVVLCDRYLWSSLVYQHQHQQDVIACNKGALMPDIVFHLDAHGEVAAGRIKTRGCATDRYEANVTEIKRRSYNNAYSVVPPNLLVVIDGNQTKDEVAKNIADAIMTYNEAIALLREPGPGPS